MDQTPLSQSRPMLWLGVAFLPALLLRLLFPLQFPMIYWDEGLWNIGPKHAVILGDPFAYGWEHLYLSPIHYLITRVLYGLFTPSLLISRLVAILFGIGNVLLIFLLGKRFLNNRIGIIAAILVAYNSLLIVSSRQALLEPEVTFFLLGAIYCWFHRRRSAILMSGLFLGIAILDKVNAIALIPALLVGQIGLSNDRSRNLKRWLNTIKKEQWYALLIAMIMVVVIFGSLYLNNPTRFSHVWLLHSIERKSNVMLGQSMGNFWNLKSIFNFASQYLKFCPEIVVLGLFGLFMLYKKKASSLLFFISWPIFTFILVTAQLHRPARYYYPILSIIILLAAYGLEHIVVTRKLKLHTLATVLILMSVFQVFRMKPFYNEARTANPSIIAGAKWLNENVPKGEPIISMYQAALFIHNPVIPAPIYLDERWRATRDSSITFKVEDANYFFWAKFKTTHRRETPYSKWVYYNVNNRYKVTQTFGTFHTVWQKKVPISSH